MLNEWAENEASYGEITTPTKNLKRAHSADTNDSVIYVSSYILDNLTPCCSSVIDLTKSDDNFRKSLKTIYFSKKNFERRRDEQTGRTTSLVYLPVKNVPVVPLRKWNSTSIIPCTTKEKLGVLEIPAIYQSEEFNARDVTFYDKVKLTSYDHQMIDMILDNRQIRFDADTNCCMGSQDIGMTIEDLMDMYGVTSIDQF